MNRLTLTITLATAFSVAGPAQAAIFETFADESQWIERVGSTIVEDFEDEQLIEGLSLDSKAAQTGAHSVESGLFDVTSDTFGVRNGVWRDAVDRRRAVTTIRLADSISGIGDGLKGFAGYWDRRPMTIGLGITVDLMRHGELIDSIELPDLKDGFWGFATDADFDTLVLSAGTRGGIMENFTLDDLQIGRSSGFEQNDPTTPVPLPAAIWLFGAGILSLLVGGRSRRA